METSNKTDFQLIREIRKNNSSQAFLELKKRHEKLFYRTAASYCNKISQLSYQELIEDVDLVLLNAIRSYKRGKNAKVSSWIGNHARYHVLNTIKKSNELSCFSNEENSTIDLLNNKSNNVFVDKNENLKDHIFHLLGELKDPRIKEIFKLRFYSDKQDQKWKNISKKIGISIQQCSNLYKAGQNLLYKKINKV